jgi:tryptophan halogenase
MKITVLGAGSSGCFTALHYGCWTQGNPNIEVELIHDPNILPTPVGIGTLLGVTELLWKSFEIDWHNNPIGAVPKTGILYEGWGKKQEEIFTPFPFSHLALHFSPKKLQEYILDEGKARGLFSVCEGNVKGYGDVDSDYIFDCRGTPTDWGEYEAVDNPLNTALISEVDGIEGNRLWTRAVATPDGWTFKIPQTSNTTSVGYLYNDSISSEDEARENFCDIFGVKEILKKLEFKNYVAKQPIIDKRVILNGNRLFFIEPLEATSLEVHLDWCKFVWDWIIDRRVNAAAAAKRIRVRVEEIKNYILWHYQFGSKYDTPFWDYAKDFKISDGRFHKCISTIGTPQFFNQDWDYGQWKPWNFKFWHDGVAL